LADYLISSQIMDRILPPKRKVATFAGSATAQDTGACSETTEHGIHIHEKWAQARSPAVRNFKL
jgi:hypothetical protein